MSVYDTTFVLNPQLEEAGLDQRIKEIVDVIGGNGGKMVKENRLGMRKLAYEIQKLTQGYYVSLVYEGDGSLVNELERRFRMDDNCLRFLTCLYQEVTNVMEGGFGDRHDRGHGDHHRPHRRDRDNDHGPRGRNDRDADKKTASDDSAKAETKSEEEAPAGDEAKTEVKAEAKTEVKAEEATEEKSEE